METKVIHTGDWHIGSFRSPEEDGVNLRSEDTIRCLVELVRVCRGIFLTGRKFGKAGAIRKCCRPGGLSWNCQRLPGM